MADDGRMAVPLLLDPVRSGEEQMDRDRQFFARWPLSGGSDAGSLFRVYRIAPGEVTVGRTFRSALPPEWGVAPGDVVVRPTGGGAVLHGEDLCFSLLLPFRPGKSLVSVYSFLHRFLGSFAGSLGVNTALKHSSCPPGDGRGTCFLEPVCGDLMVESRKVLGGAMKINSQGFLYQGSLLLPGYSPAMLMEQFPVWYTGSRRLFVRNGRLLMDE